MADTKQTPYRKQMKELEAQRQEFVPHWLELQEFIIPDSGKYLSSKDEKRKDGGKKNRQKIINGTGGKALNVLSSGLQGGMTSPSQTWFRLAHPDSDTMDAPGVRQWYQDVRDIMLEILSRSNAYDALHGLYEEVAGYGTGVLLMDEDLEEVINVTLLTAGEYYLGSSRLKTPDTLYRRIEMSSNKMVEEFGEENVSESVKVDKKEHSGEKTFKIIHCIRPRLDRDLDKYDSGNMPFESVYYEEGTDDDKFLREGGYQGIPFIAPRWYVKGQAIYGRSPAMEALGDVKQLQSMEKDKIGALKKMVNPAMNAPTSMRNTGGSIVPGSINYIDQNQGQQGFQPSYQVNPNVEQIGREIERVERRIQTYFFNDLFLSIIAEEKQMTAREVAERSAEKMMNLGPVLERFQSESLDVFVGRLFNIANSFGLIPPLPEAIDGSDIKVEYISMLAQAQMVRQVGNIEQLMGFTGNLGQVNPSVWDKIDTDETINSYSEKVGTPNNLIRDENEVEAIRANRAQQEQQAQQMASQQASVEGAKTLSDTEMGTNSALDSLLEGVTGAASATA